MNLEDRNRQNAQHSTGPKTAEGKAKSAQNARKHGLSAAHLFIPEGAADEFHALYTSHFDEVRPVGEIQMQLFEQLIHAAWNTQIARRLLADALHRLDAKLIANANRYVAQYERSYAKALSGLRQLQTDLALRAAAENEPIDDLPLTCEVKVIAREATKLATLAAPRDPATKQTQRQLILHRIGHAFRAAAAATNVPNEPETGVSSDPAVTPEAA